MEKLLWGLVIILSVGLVLAIFGLVIYIRKVTAAVKDISEACNEISRQAVLVGADIRSALERLNELIRSTHNTMDTAGRIATHVERLVDGRTIAGAAEKVVSTSRSTLAVLVEAVKEGVKAFKSAGSNKSKLTSDTSEMEQS